VGVGGTDARRHARRASRALPADLAPLSVKGETMTLMARCLAAAFLLAIGSLGAAAQDYPTKPIRFIVPWPPGGGADIVSRIVGQRVGELFGQQLVIDNRAGAGGNIGAEAGVRATPDGYTILFSYIGTHAINPGLYKA